jgi:hypothetical protein
MFLQTIFQLYLGGHFSWLSKPEYLERTVDMPQVTNILCHILLYGVHQAMNMNRIHKVYIFEE